MERGTKERKRHSGEGNSTAGKIWRAVRPLLIVLISAGICVFVFAFAFNKVKAKLFSPVDINDATPVEITINSGSGASSIAKKLYEAGGVDEEGNIVSPGLITSKTVFKIYVDFTGKSSKLKAGTYILSRNMDIEQIVDVICEGNPPRTTLKFVVTEGMTAEDIADKLVTLGVLKAKSEFLNLCKTGESFKESYPFVANIPVNSAQARDYALEGYLSPNTYEIYTSATPEEIIKKLLSQTEAVFRDEWHDRADALGMTMDQVITLASLIEKEAKQADFARVSAVFHNRLKINMALGSDVTIKYVTGTERMSLNNSDLSVDSPYNTYRNKGLPPGPICNPSAAAIEAALYPDETFTAQNYLYFCSKDPATGELYFSRTLEEHEAAVKIYAPLWQAYDEKTGAK